MIRAFIPSVNSSSTKELHLLRRCARGIYSVLNWDMKSTILCVVPWRRIRDSDSHKLLAQDAPELSDCTFKSTAESLTSEEATSTPIANAELDEHGMPVHGKCMWVKWRVNAKNGSIFWPCIAMHPVQDYAYIPSEALADRSAKLSQSIDFLFSSAIVNSHGKELGNCFHLRSITTKTTAAHLRHERRI